MDCGRPSRTIGPGRLLDKPSRRCAGHVRPVTSLAAALVVMAVATVSGALFAASCSQGLAVPAAPGSRLEPGTTYSVDLDDDPAAELILIDGDPASLTLTDGDVSYRSREKWRVIEAHLGDTDHDGLPEVVALLEADDGRHIGLFSYFGGSYRERFVSSALVPRPLSLRISSKEATEDVIVVSEEPRGRQTETTVVYRWNGFGFAIEARPSD